MAARFLTPDWSKNPQGVPYANYADPQSLNLYSYMRDNPLSGVDADGHLGLGDAPPCKVMRGTTCANAQDATEFKKEDAKHLAGQKLAVRNLVDAQNAAMNNPKFAPGYGGHTHCNQGACSVARAMHAPMGPFSGCKSFPCMANQIRANLARSCSGYHTVTATDAAQLAEHGVVVYITGPGHIATVAANQNQNLPGRGPIIANVGYKNGDMRLDYVFTKSAMPEVRFYAPNQ